LTALRAAIIRRAMAKTVRQKGPLDLSVRSWWRAAKASVREFREDNLMDWAAALTYYSVLSLFPGLIVLVALVGLLGQYPETTNAILDIIDRLGPSSAVETFRDPVEGVVKSKGGAGALLGVGLLVAIWSASGYIGAFTRASNAIYEVRESRSFWKLRPLQVLITLISVVVVSLLAIALVLTGDLARAVGDEIGVGDTAVSAWSIAKWPVLLILVTTIISALYYITPNIRQTGFRWITPGGVVAVALWVIASAGFALYVSHFGSYNKTYGSLGAVIIFLIWLWLTNIAILFGAEFNSELERSRQIDAGVPSEKALSLEARGDPAAK
jgi:membrane protein